MMQQIAAENNLSETAFVVHQQNEEYELRWFTPKTEIDLCGHATLATAFVVFQYLNRSITQVKFHTKSGILTVTKNGSLLTMSFPSREGLTLGNSRSSCERFRQKTERGVCS